MTSHATVSMMFAIEDAFEVEFPEHMLNVSTFASINSISEALESLVEEKATAELGPRP